MLSFDLQGFGKNANKGSWFSIDSHIDDILKLLKILKQENPKKKIYLLGESMGGAIVLSLANSKKNLPIDGIILVAPVIWNFTERNFFKSLTLNFFSKIFPSIKISGDGLIDVKASDNIKMLKQLSKDPYFIHKPTLESLNGIIKLMDKSFYDSQNYLKNPAYDTLMIIPIIDEIIPRKPLLELLNDKEVLKKFDDRIKLSIYEKNYHMILRDINGNRVTREIKEWIFKNKNLDYFYSFQNSLTKLRNSEFHHRLDK